MQVAIDSRQLVLDLHRCLQDLDPARLETGIITRLRTQLDGLRGRLVGLLERWPEDVTNPLRAKLGDLAEVLAQRPEAEPLEAWADFRTRLQDIYEDVAKSLARLDVHVPSLRPTNYRRNAFHVFCGTTVLLLVELVLTPSTMLMVAGAFAVLAWGMETSRRYSATANRFLMWLFGPVAHPHEAHRINSSTWYTTALLIVALMGNMTAAAMAVIVLGLGDPAAAIIGRRFGRTKLINGRSLEGSLAFIAAGGLAAFIVLQVFHGELTLFASVAVALAAATAGAVAELVSRKIDDNLSIPLATAAATIGALSLVI